MSLKMVKVDFTDRSDGLHSTDSDIDPTTIEYHELCRSQCRIS